MNHEEIEKLIYENKVLKLELQKLKSKNDFYVFESNTNANNTISIQDNKTDVQSINSSNNNLKISDMNNNNSNILSPINKYGEFLDSLKQSQFENLKLGNKYNYVIDNRNQAQFKESINSSNNVSLSQKYMDNNNNFKSYSLQQNFSNPPSNRDTMLYINANNQLISNSNHINNAIGADTSSRNERYSDTNKIQNGKNNRHLNEIKISYNPNIDLGNNNVNDIISNLMLNNNSDFISEKSTKKNSNYYKDSIDINLSNKKTTSLNSSTIFKAGESLMSGQFSGLNRSMGLDSKKRSPDVIALKQVNDRLRYLEKLEKESTTNLNKQREKIKIDKVKKEEDMKKKIENVINILL